MSKKMKTQQIKIKQNQYLNEVIEQLPSNAIIKKGLTGIGATTMEIKTHRNSIIIEPNVPVLIGKMKQHNDILVVYENVTVYHIEKYLFNDEIVHKKILTTPESFDKIKVAMVKMKIDMYKDYFLLFDECERTAKDVDFREDIIKPMDDFFLFKAKSFISATAEIPSDPRFTKQNFKIYEIVPDFDHSKKLELVASNNPKAFLKDRLKQLIEDKTEQPVFIFFNSIVGSVSMIESFSIQKNSALFCSKSALENIKKNKIQAYEKFNTCNMKGYNFMTSRFFSAMDIVLEEGIKPHVIMVTDLNVAHHSMIDPMSDAIQIPGRFRNGITSLTFISNFCEGIDYKTQESASEYLKGVEDFYVMLSNYKGTAKGQAVLDVLTEITKNISFAKFMKEDCTRNHYMFDNYYNQERIKSYFVNKEALYKVFNESLSQYFNVQLIEQNYRMESVYLKPKGIRAFKEILAQLVSHLDIILDKTEEHLFTLFDRITVYNDIKQKYPYVITGYELLGREKLLSVGYCKDSIESALLDFRQQQGFESFDFLKEFKMKFGLKSEVLQKDALNTFITLCKKYDLEYKRTLGDLGNFLKFSERKKNKGLRYLYIQEYRF